MTQAASLLRVSLLKIEPKVLIFPALEPSVDSSAKATIKSHFLFLFQKS